MSRKLFRNARIFTPVDHGAPAAGKGQGKVRRFEKGALLCRGGVVEAAGEERDVLRTLSPRDVDMEVDCEGLCLIPGLVDPHTHMCFAQRREAEFSLRLAGTDYLEILRQGGGILSSVRAVRQTSEDALYENTRQHALSALRFGTTTLEIKSGYGLEEEAELKMLRAVERVGRQTPLDVAPTFLGAHAIPEEHAAAPDEYVDLLIREMIPTVRRQGIARFCDVFCEQGVFSVDQSRRILQAAGQAGLKLKIHADEVHDLGGAGLAAELRAVSAEHLLNANDENLRSMVEQGVTAVLLPGTAYSLRKPYARARTMVEMGLPLAIATDCNPGSCYCESMPFVFGLAVLNMGLSVAEALVAATLNAAYAVDMAPAVGSLDVGKQADFLLLDGDSPAILAYHAGVSPVVQVYKLGERVSGPHPSAGRRVGGNES
jgi:imidazolonepropionase